MTIRYFGVEAKLFTLATSFFSMPGDRGRLTVQCAEESPPSTSSVDRRKSVAREGRQGRRNDTVRNEDESVAEDVVAGFGETATPHRSKSKHGRTLSQMPLKQKGAYGGDLAPFILFQISHYAELLNR